MRQRRAASIQQLSVGRHPGVEQTRGLQCGFEAGLQIGRHCRREFDQLPQRRAAPTFARAGRAPCRWRGQGVFAGLQPRALRVQRGLF
ncbi:hypothetical protein XPR_3714, partial [Xanthomonas arboricola pv. pruni MAFF 301420]